MQGNRRGLILLAVLLVVAVMVYVLKNQRNHPGSYVSGPQQVKVETQNGELAQDPASDSLDSRLNLGQTKPENPFR